MSGTVTSDTIFLVSTAMDAKSVFINSLHTWEAHHILPPPWNSVLSWLLFQCVCWESALTHCANEAIKLRNSRQDKTFRNKTHCGVLMCLRFSLFLFVCLFVCLGFTPFSQFLSKIWAAKWTRDAQRSQNYKAINIYAKRCFSSAERTDGDRSLIPYHQGDKWHAVWSIVRSHHVH